jgi:hypothetical protein
MGNFVETLNKGSDSVADMFSSEQASRVPVYSAGCIDVNVDFSIDIETMVVLMTVTEALLVKGVVGGLAESLSVS